MTVKLFLGAALAVLPTFALADDFVVPAGCQAFLTVQSSGCTVAHYWTCEADPEGHFWRVSVDADGPYFLSQSDAEYRWLQGYGLRAAIERRLIEPEEDPASLSDLLETGEDTMVFSLERFENGVRYEREYRGFDRLTGAEAVIDGETLLLTDFAYEFDTPDGVQRVSGNQFLHPDWRLFFGGIETVVLPTGEVFEDNYAPREFLQPGEAGYLSNTPRYDCEAIMSGPPPAMGDRG